MDKTILIEKVNTLFYEIIDELKDIDKETREYNLIVPEFSRLKLRGIRSKPIKKQEYSTFIFHNIDSLRKFAGFQELLEYIESNCELKSEIIHHLIEELFKWILDNCREKVCINKIRKFIDLFYEDLLNKLVKFSIKEYFIGISLEDESYKIDEDLIIRKANSFDFECKDMGEYESELRKYPFHFPPVILKYKYTAARNIESYTDYSRPSELFKELDFIDWAFLLFRSVPIFRVKTVSKIKSLFKRGTISEGFISMRTGETYFINKDNVEDLKNTIRIFKRLEIGEIFEITKKKPNHINIALNRYRNALFFAENIPQKIVSLISCLEALLSEGGPELKRRLSQRVSIVLKSIGYDPLDVYEEINTAYRIRNNYSHGTTIDLKSSIKKDVNEFLKNITEYTRLCFLISMQIKPIKNKKEYLKLIDISLLDENSYSEFANLITENCIIFKD